MTYLEPEDYRDFQWKQTEDYINGVKDGSIITNEWIKLAVERFENDVNREDVSILVEEVDKVYEYFSLLNIDLDNEIGQFNLFPFQSFILAGIFGPYWSGTDIRKYQEIFMYVARGGGKTSFVAAILSFILEMGWDPFPEGILVAHSRDQANRALDTLHRLVMQTPELEEDLGFNRRMIYRKPGPAMGFIETVPSMEASLQGYKLTTCILDEIHTYNDNKLYTAAKKGMSKKKNPMLFMTSTAGDNDKQFCKDQIEYSQKVLKGEVQDESFFPMLYMPDKEDLGRWTDEDVWHKANPALGTIKKIEAMRNQLNKAKYFPDERYDFLTYDLNVYTESIVKWIPDEYIIPVMKKLDMTTFEDRECYIGADFSEVEDLTSLAFLFPIDGGESFEAKIIYIFPDAPDKIKRKGNKSLKPWLEAEDEYIIQCSTTVIDDEVILEQVKDANDFYDVQGFGYDTRAGKKIAEAVKDILSEDYVSPIAQGFGLSPAIKEIQKLVHTKKITIDDNPVTHWNFDNVVIRPDDFGNWKLDKKKSKESIDGVVALCNAYKMWEEINYDSDVMASESSLDYWKNKQ